MTVDLRRVLASALAIISALAIGLTGAAQAATPHSHSHRPHHQAAHHHNKIPQHNGGDRDGDNNGGASDRDGNV